MNSKRFEDNLHLTLDFDPNPDVRTYVIYGWINDQKVGEEAYTIPAKSIRTMLCEGSIKLSFMGCVIPKELYQCLEAELSKDPVVRLVDDYLEKAKPLPHMITDEMLTTYKDQ